MDKLTPAEAKAIATAHVEFLKAHPEYQDVYSWSILTVRLPGERFEHYRYAEELNTEPSFSPQRKHLYGDDDRMGQRQTEESLRRDR